MAGRHGGSTSYLIVNADDLGTSTGVNRGIFEASERGIVTSASLMVDTPASADAAGHLRLHPQLGVGLHVALTEPGGTLKIAPERCDDELERQLARFQALTQRTPTHVDSHHHVHRDARLEHEFVTFAKRHALPLRGHGGIRYLPNFYGQTNGATRLERVSVAALVELLESEVDPGITELGCHPGYSDAGLRSSYSIEREAELTSLCDPGVRRRIDELDIRLINFTSVARPGIGPPR